MSEFDFRSSKFDNNPIAALLYEIVLDGFGELLYSDGDGESVTQMASPTDPITHKDVRRYYGTAGIEDADVDRILANMEKYFPDHCYVMLITDNRGFVYVDIVPNAQYNDYISAMDFDLDDDKDEDY